MKDITSKPLEWLMAQTRFLRYFIIALLLHVALIAVLGSIKIVAILPKMTASFEGAPLPSADKEPDDPNAVYRDFEYRGPTLGGGGGTPGKGAGGIPTAGGVPETYQAHMLTPSAQNNPDNAADVIAVMNDVATAIERPIGGPSGVDLTPLSGMGDTGIGTLGVKGPGGGILGARIGPQRAINLNKFQGSAETEKAVVAALRWLKGDQNRDGSWKCGKSAPMGAALATLAFLGHGETPDSAEFGQTVSKGLLYLAQQVDSNGLVIGFRQDDVAYGYSQGAVARARSEGYAMTQSPVLREPLDRALGAILQGQSAVKARPQDVGGWRYHPSSDDSDVSVTGWMIMALKSAEAADIEIPRPTFDSAAQYLWNMYDTRNPGFGYQKPERYPSMTAVGVLCQQFLGNGKDQRIKGALDYLREQKVDWDKTSGDYVMYGWYYITQAMFQGGGNYWQYWNGEIRQTMVKNQRSDGRWMPPPHSDIEGKNFADTPAYSTALGAMILEVYYRYLPIYQLVEQSSESGAASTAPKSGPEPAHD